MVHEPAGKLYIVATPIGNLDDISIRALAVLRNVALVAVEDTRHSSRLLQAFGINTPMLALHDFNESARVAGLLEKMRDGADIALISDAGTPLISDPGYQLVRAAHKHGFQVVPIPGASAAITALSVAGLATDRFCFEGFLPARQAARKSALLALAREPRSMIFYEAPHRIVECLEDMVSSFGGSREACLARELTKNFETVKHVALQELLDLVTQDLNQQRGEIVLVVAGYKSKDQELGVETLHLLSLLLEELPLKQAAGLAARISGLKKSELYDAGLHLQGKKD
jgi:16S rRNA (cytidine1402-2'-O)-methyltransferase